ncbi:pheromone A receptor-domain-containing protein [Roridomyces roridus]|uniref:Pheromone A receptor-domain-containing protein n=1 Tax=Roridomyces roridus TaxID=1738132 RepID=A0AAD7FG88_9AGAR|nr:pheromone A receptor-domain-containing protein [Roridomyces roridus]
MFDPLYPLFSTCSFLGFVLVLIPLPWHLQAWNSGTCFYIMWSALSCLNQFVNSVVWADDMINRAPVWCDISIRITLAASVGIPAASLCINRRLYQIASVKTVSVTVADKRRAVLIDTLICVVFPLVYIALQYIVQGHRFNIYEQIGCAPALYNSVPFYFITLMWPPLIGITSATYGILSLRAFTRRRAAFSQLLSAHSSLTAGRYLRLMALAATDILLTTPLGIFAIVMDAVTTPILPWISFANTHLDYGRVEQIPAIFWRSSPLGTIPLEFTRWTAPATAFIFFAFFGFAIEARKNYALAFGVVSSAFWRVLARLGVRRPSSGFLAAKSTSSSRGMGYPKPEPSKRSATATEDISLPAYSSAAGTGSFTESFASVADLKRSSSFATQGSTSSYTASPFVEEDGKLVDEEKALSIHEALSLPPRSPSPSSAYIVPHPATDPVTPDTATSFATSTTEYVLPLHVGWHEHPYPVDTGVFLEDDGGSISGSSTAHSPTSTTSSQQQQSRFSYPQTQYEQQSRGPRSLV